MEAAGYTTLTRQNRALARDADRGQQYRQRLDDGLQAGGADLLRISSNERGRPSLSMAQGNVRSRLAGRERSTRTGGPLDLAIEGEGFFRSRPRRRTADTGGQLHANGRWASSSPRTGSACWMRAARRSSCPRMLAIWAWPPTARSATGRPLAQLGVVRPAEGTDAAARGRCHVPCRGRARTGPGGPDRAGSPGKRPMSTRCFRSPG